MTNRKKIISLLEKDMALNATTIVQHLGVSRSYVHRLLQQLQKEGIVVVFGKTHHARYALVEHKDAVENLRSSVVEITLRLRRSEIAEDIVFSRIVRETGIFLGVSGNIFSAVQFGFTEMLNNAIDHSRSKDVVIRCERSSTAISFSIRDHGIGIFNNVRQTLKLPGTLEAINELLKGKTTTMPEAHTGQGIFFTSKIADTFIVDSGDKRLTINNLLPDIFISDRKTIMAGTNIFFVIGLKSKKEISEIFDSYVSTEDDSFEFSKNRIHVKLFQFGTSLLSRSEAKRVMMNLEHFQEIELDFQGVATIGQGFADQIFRVWHMAHPTIQLTPINTNENVAFMVKRAGGTIGGN